MKIKTLKINSVDADGEYLPTRSDAQVKAYADAIRMGAILYDHDPKLLKELMEYAVAQNDEALALAIIENVKENEKAFSFCEQKFEIKAGLLRGQFKRASLVYLAAIRGWKDVMTTLHELDVQLDFEPENSYWRPIYLAAYCGHLDIIEFILEKYPNSVNQTQTGDPSPIFYAIQGGEYEVLNTLLTNKNIQENWTTEVHIIDGGLLLKNAAAYAYTENQLKMLKLIIKKGGSTTGVPHAIVAVVKKEGELVDNLKAFALNIPDIQKSYISKQTIISLLEKNEITFELNALLSNPNLDIIHNYYGFNDLCRLANINLKSGGDEAYKGAYKLYATAIICKLNKSEKKGDKIKAEAIKNALKNEFNLENITTALIDDPVASNTNSMLSFLWDKNGPRNAAYENIPNEIKTYFKTSIS